jgi:hypothetical protein
MQTLAHFRFGVRGGGQVQWIPNEKQLKTGEMFFEVSSLLAMKLQKAP